MGNCTFDLAWRGPCKATCEGSVCTQPGAVYAELPQPDSWFHFTAQFWENKLRDFADRTHALRMQAAPKAAPGEPSAHQILAITTAYEQGVGKGHQAYKSGKEIANPYSPAYRCDLAWQYGYKEGKEQAQREAKAAPQQEAQEPVGVVEHAQAQTSYIHWTAAPPPNGAKLYTAPQPAPDCHHRPPCDECRIAAQGGKT